MRLFIGLILLAFPFAEIFLLVKLAHLYGWWVLFYLVAIGFLGLQLIRGEKLLMGPKLMQSISAGGNPIRALLSTARNMVAGVLLIIPGVITDIIAVIILLIPIQNNADNTSTNTGKPNPNGATNQQQANPKYQRRNAANDDIIEGEFTEIKDE